MYIFILPFILIHKHLNAGVVQHDVIERSEQGDTV